jgi:Right handed beta helix region
MLSMCLAGFSSGPVHGAIYHIDAVHGADSQSGLAPDQAWRSLDKVNMTPLKPGDEVRFKSGNVWKGRLNPQGGGSANAPVRIHRYGNGPLPRIEGGGLHGDAVLLENFAHVWVSELEITNTGPHREPWRTGIRVCASGAREVAGVRLEKLHVRDVNGDLRKDSEGCGIYFETKGDKACFNGLAIENCRVERTDRNGICQRGIGRTRSRNVVIRGNTLEDIGGDGIKLWGTNGGLIEHNVVRKARARCTDNEAAAGIWPFACDDTVIQFNEVSGTVGTRDGQGFDADYHCRRTLIQYNYSHGNEGGFLLVCGPGRTTNEDTVVRYNLSVHDGVNSARVFHFGGASQRTRIYNNTIILGHHQDLPMVLFTAWKGGTADGVEFFNNLFVVGDGGRATYQLKPSNGVRFSHNLFVGRHEGLPAGVSAGGFKPRFAGPLQPRPGSRAVHAFRPLGGSSFPRGVIVANHGGRDLAGNRLPSGLPPAIGALEPPP